MMGTEKRNDPRLQPEVVQATSLTGARRGLDCGRE